MNKPDKLQARKLRRLRRRMKLTQTQLGAHLGRSYVTVWAYEKGRSPIPPSVMRDVERLAESTK